MNKPKLNEKDTKKVIQMYRSYRTLKEIRETFGITDKTIYNILRRNNVPMNNTKNGERLYSEAEKIEELLKKDMIFPEIAKILEMPLSRVKYISSKFSLHVTKKAKERLALKAAEDSRKKYRKKETICWECERCMIDCKKPLNVKGWVADKVLYSEEPLRYTYLVYECPNFKADERFRKSK